MSDLLTVKRNRANTGIYQDAPVSYAGGFDIPCTVDIAMVRGSDYTNVATLGDCHYFRVRDGGSISKIAIDVGNSSGNISVAVYANVGKGTSAVPGARLATSGAVACPAVGYAEVSLGATVDLNPGDWLAISADNIAATFLCVLAGVGSHGPAAVLGNGRHMKQASAHPAPATPASLAGFLGDAFVLQGRP